jgi:hypothetical protein
MSSINDRHWTVEVPNKALFDVSSYDPQRIRQLLNQALDALF